MKKILFIFTTALLISSCHRDTVVLEREYDQALCDTFYHVKVDGWSKFTTMHKKEADSVFNLIMKYGDEWDRKPVDTVDKVLRIEQRPMEFNPFK